MTMRIFMAVAVGLTVSACGLVSGVSNDFTFDEPADGASASTDGAPDAPAPGPDGAPAADANVPKVDASAPDASAPDAAGNDAAGATCVNALARPGSVTPACFQCFFERCCSALQLCQQQDEAKCGDYLKCAEACEAGALGEGCRTSCASRATGTAPAGLVTCGRTARCVPEVCVKR